MANPWPEGEGQFQGGILALRFWLVVSYCFNQCFEILFVLLNIWQQNFCCVHFLILLRLLVSLAFCYLSIFACCCSCCCRCCHCHGDGGGGESVAKGGRQPRGSRLDHERPLVELLVIQKSGVVQEIVENFLDLFDLVGGLLELTNLANDVRNLGIKKKINLFNQNFF